MKTVTYYPKWALMWSSFQEGTAVDRCGISNFRARCRYYLHHFLLVSIALFYSSNLDAQTCLPEGITFSAQEQVDSFTLKISRLC